MTDTAADTPSEQSPDSIRLQAEQLLDAIKTAKAQAEDNLKAAEVARQKAEEHLKAAELARQKADSEALFAFNAKGACERHSTDIAQLKGTVEAEVNSIVTNKQKSDDLLATITANKPVMEGDIKAIGDRRKEVDQASQEIVKAAQTGAARLGEIEASRTAADASLKTANEAREAVLQARDTSHSAQEEAAKFSADAKTFAASIAENLKTSNEGSGDIQKLVTDARTNNTQLATILEHLTKSDGIAGGYETRLAALTKQLESQIERVDVLLPGAASAGLASAFCAQKRKFARSQKLWAGTFIACIVLLLIVSLPSFIAAVFPSTMAAWTGKSTEPTWNETLHGFVMRLPILIALVWLAVYAGRHYMLSLRLGEDYAYKEAISTAFEGYKREMQGIQAGEATNPTPINTLCVNILTAIAERPGRIYEHHNKDITLANEALALVARAKELGQRQTRTQ
jgi:hypothetical protein